MRRVEICSVYAITLLVIFGYSHSSFRTIPFVSPLLTFESVHVKESVLEIGTVLLFILWSINAFFEQRIRIHRSPLNLALLLYGAWICAEYYFTPFDAVGAFELRRQLSLLALSFVISQRFPVNHLFRYLYSILFAAFLSAGIGILKYLSDTSHKDDLIPTRAEGLFGHPTIFAGFLVFPIILAGALLLSNVLALRWKESVVIGAKKLVTLENLLVLLVGAFFGLCLGGVPLILNQDGVTIATSAIGTILLFAFATIYVMMRKDIEEQRAGSVKMILFLMALISVAVYALFLTFARGGVAAVAFAFGLGVLFAILSLFRKRGEGERISRKPFVYVGLGLLIVFAALGYTLRGSIPESEFKRMFAVRNQALDNTIRIRRLSWEGALRLIWDDREDLMLTRTSLNGGELGGILKQRQRHHNFIWGGGLGSFGALFPDYQSMEMSEVSLLRRNYLDHAHNEFIQVFAETGILGFTLFVYLVVTILYSGFSLAFSETDRSRKIVYLAMTLALGAALLDGCVSINFRYASTPFLFFAVAGIVARLRADQRGEKPLDLRLGYYGQLVTSTVLSVLLLTPLYFTAKAHFSQNEFLFGVIDFNGGRVDKAFRHFETAVDLCPERIDFRYRLATMLYHHATMTEDLALRVARLQAADAHFDMYRRQQPYYPGLNYNLALVDQAIGAAQSSEARKTNAMFHLSDELLANPYNYRARFLRAMIAMSMAGRENEALSELSEYRHFAPVDTVALNVMGSAHLRLDKQNDDDKHLRLAKEEFALAQLLDPGDSISALNMMIMEFADGNDDAALDYAVRALEFEKPFAEILIPIDLFPKTSQHALDKLETFNLMAESILGTGRDPTRLDDDPRLEFADHLAVVNAELSKFVKERSPLSRQVLHNSYIVAHASIIDDLLIKARRERGNDPRLRFAHAMLMIRASQRDHARAMLSPLATDRAFLSLRDPEKREQERLFAARANFYLGQIDEREQRLGQALAHYEVVRSIYPGQFETLLAMRSLYSRIGDFGGYTEVTKELLDISGAGQ
ncbi:MAG: O-antigen ligase family protein [Planctomycetes bacterium]|nr:O-antigen ligase family protein [Planctomycetota bacterium]